MVPDDGKKSPVTQLNSVVLPAPLEPSTARRSPGRTVMVTSVSAASAPNIRVTPRSSSAAPAATDEKRSVALPRAMAAAFHCRFASPAFPQSDHAVRGPEHDGEEAEPDQQPESITVEPDLDQEIEREGAQDDEDKGADVGTDGTGNAADHGDDQNVDAGANADRAGRDLPVVPDLQHAAQRGDKGREGIGRHAVRVDIEAERRHPARVVTDALQSQAERRAGDILHGEIAERGDAQCDIVVGDVGTPV